MNLIELLMVMQSGVNPHKAGRIIGCNIVYVMFLIICNSIINQTKKTNKCIIIPISFYITLATYPFQYLKEMKTIVSTIVSKVLQQGIQIILLKIVYQVNLL